MAGYNKLLALLQERKVYLSSLLTGDFKDPSNSGVGGRQTVRSCILPTGPPGTKALGWGMRVRGFKRMQTQQNLFPLVPYGERTANGRRVCASPNATLPVAWPVRNSGRKHLLRAWLCSEYFTHDNSFNLPISLERRMVLSYPLYRWDKQATKTLSPCPRPRSWLGFRSRHVVSKSGLLTVDYAGSL